MRHAAESGFVGRGNLNNGHVNRSQEGFDQLGNLNKAAGDQIPPAFGDGLIRHLAVNECFQAEILGLKGLE